jgi:hypothetical protein
MIALVLMTLTAGLAGEQASPAPKERPAPPPIVVRGNGESKSYDCKGAAIAVDGDENHLSLRNCSKVMVNGNENDLRLEENCPALSIPGNDNVVAAGKVETISILGNENTVTWTSDSPGRKPSISNLGSGNSVSRTSR